MFLTVRLTMKESHFKMCRSSLSVTCQAALPNSPHVCLIWHDYISSLWLKNILFLKRNLHPFLSIFFFYLFFIRSVSTMLQTKQQHNLKQSKLKELLSHSPGRIYKNQFCWVIFEILLISASNTVRSRGSLLFTHTFWTVECVCLTGDLNEPMFLKKQANKWKYAGN